MAREMFDTERLIIEVEQRPVIWDHRLKEYSNKFLKEKAWEELCGIFFKNFEEMDSGNKNKAAMDLQRKWKSCRDSFRRELSKLQKTKSGSAAESGRKQYLFFHLLQFLRPTSETKPVSPTMNEDVDVDTIEKIDAEADVPPRPAPTSSDRKRKRSQCVEEELLQTLLKSLNERSQEQSKDDPDRHFLLSLLPHFKSIPEFLKLELQGEFISVLQKYKQRALYMGEPSSSGYQLFTRPSATLGLAMHQPYHGLHNPSALHLHTPSTPSTSASRDSALYTLNTLPNTMCTQPVHIDTNCTDMNSPTQTNDSPLLENIF